MKKLLVLSLLLCFATYGYAQCSTPSHIEEGYKGTEQSFNDFASVGKNISKKFERNLFISNAAANSKNSVYLFNSWDNKGTIHYAGKQITFEKVNFNLKANRLEILLSNNTVYAIDHNSFEKLVVGSKVYINDKKKGTIQEEIAELDGAKIVKEFKLKVKKGRVNPLTQVKETSDKNYIAESYYKLDAGKRKKITLDKALSYKNTTSSKKRVVQVYGKK